MPMLRRLKPFVLVLSVCCAWALVPALAQADTVTFNSTGTEQAFTVPAGVTSVNVVAIGGSGGSFGLDLGGFGAQASADIAVTPGELLYVEVGGNGSDGNADGTGGAGGFNGGGAGGSEIGSCGCEGGGAGGGGASDVRTVARSQAGTFDSRLIVAGAGGGASPEGSSGGAAGQPGGGPSGGGAGTPTAGGSPNGGLGVGGPGSDDSSHGAGGGGGGAGLYGGGGGLNGAGISTAASGGGGGSSGFGAGAANTSVVAAATATPSITFTYTPIFHALTIAKAGSGAGTVTSTDGQLNCGSTCSHSYPAGTTVTLNASAASGSSFGGWSGGGCSGSGSCTVTMSSDQSVTATFSAILPSPPNTTIGQATINSSKGTATFKFKARGQKTGFQCALVRKHKKPKFKSCRSPKTYKKLKPGKYTFEVRAVGPGGTDPSPAKKKFKIE
jgi:Divergent InlB B-repeat domain